MLSLFVKLLLFGVAAWIVVSMLHGQCAFEIRVREGRPSVRRGKVTPAFLGTVAHVCHSNQIVDGWIRGQIRGTRTRLQFSRQFPAECQQQLLNEWQFVG